MLVHKNIEVPNLYKVGTSIFEAMKLTAAHYRFFLFFFFFGNILFGQLPFTIEEMAELPESLSNNAVCEGFIDGEPYVYTFCGIDSSLSQGGIHLKSWRYDTSLDLWEVLDSIPDIAGKIAASASRVGDVIYIIGGYYVAPNGNETSSTKVHRFHIPSNSFLTDGADIPVAIDDQVQTVWRDSLIYVVTGWSNTTNVPNVQIYNPFQDTWQVGTAVPNNNLYKVFGASGTIIEDTIYYYGGASVAFNFPATFQIRKGVINPSSPVQITWSVDTLDADLFAYRMAALEINDSLFFIGGSKVSYNYDALAYDGSGVVAPSSQIIVSSTSYNYQVDSSLAIPMDLRSVAKTAANEFYIVGGIGVNAIQSNKLLKCTWRKEMPVGLKAEKEKSFKIYPNPARSTLFIQDDKDQIRSYQILNLQGKVVLPKSKNLTIDITTFSSGVYIIQLETVFGRISEKVIIP